MATEESKMTSRINHGFDFVAFGGKVEAAARRAFEEVAMSHCDEKLCAFAL
jgi:hypothetical protein